MSEDFYINYSCASQPKPKGDGYRMLRDPPRERIDALLPLLRNLLQSDVKPDEKHICPICGQTIEISFEYYKEIPNELDISSSCETCRINVFFKSSRIPAWVRAISLFDRPYL